MNEGSFNITVVGLGVVGGSYAMALRELNPKGLFGVDVNPDTLRKAENMGIIDRGYTKAEEPLKKSDLVIICIYPGQIRDFIYENINYFKKGTVITDTAGVKTELIDEINSIIPESVDFIFGHPMAGREKKGLDFASREVFKNANYIITPTERNHAENINLIEELAMKIGFSRTVRISPEKHDEVISYTSQLPHAIAVALINSESFDNSTGSFIGDSFRDFTRIASINEELWTELFFKNNSNLVKQIELFEEKLSIIKNAIVKKDKNILVENFIEAGRRRGAI
ncbi:prephenate dehydrogenase [Lutispora sp.]|uniref:prephenate dehydrogenase n=1 Tax=Lutispora sp. TaxID=2828727 RepID=UPI002B21E862|nr:prephenate dehydrogenase [Lutispora sp.]MEA4961198.1 prephenate dehydrogenase [Lutispora sp.]